MEITPKAERRRTDDATTHKRTPLGARRISALAMGSRVPSKATLERALKGDGVTDQDKKTGQPSGGELLSAISTRIVALLRDHYGRGPMKAKTYVLDDLVVCVLRNGFIPIE